MQINTNICLHRKVLVFTFSKVNFAQNGLRLVVLKKLVIFIYKFSCSGKTILFLGLDLKFNKLLRFLKLKTRHIYLPKSLWLNGLFSNGNVFKQFFYKLKFNSLLSLKNKHSISLIVFFGNCKVLQELSRSKLVFVDLTLFQRFKLNLPLKVQYLIVYLLIFILHKKCL